VGREAGEVDRPGQLSRLLFGGTPVRAVAHDEQAGSVRRPNALISVPTSFCGAIRPM
jgi:hypothetical protein